jgi:hypothetical protein
VADRDQPAVARRIQNLAESGDYEGFNAIAGTLVREHEFEITAIDVVRRDADFRNRVTDLCRESWERKHTKQ